MKVHLVLRSHEDERQIGRVMDSVSSQMRKPDKVIIAFRNSWDNTISLCEEICCDEFLFESVEAPSEATENSYNERCFGDIGDIVIVSMANCVLPEWYIACHVDALMMAMRNVPAVLSGQTCEFVSMGLTHFYPDYQTVRGHFISAKYPWRSSYFNPKNFSFFRADEKVVDRYGCADIYNVEIPK